MLLRHASRLSTRLFSTSSAAVVYSQYGAPQNVLSRKEIALDDPSGSQVLVKMMAAPINPADVNMIEGTYPIGPEGEEKVGGNEGLGVVEAVGPGVSKVQKGDWVTPVRPGFGTWRTHALTDESLLRKIPSNIPMEFAATLSVNPCTAYRMLTDFVNLSKGDVVIQNACNSAVGQCVIQLAHLRGIKTINILRDRPKFAETVEYLKSLGADIVVTEEYAHSAPFKTLIADLPKPKLGLNCVGGPSARDLARVLEHGGTLVTYGGMGRAPVTLPTSLLIFNDLICRGFWLSHWNETHSEAEFDDMVRAITHHVKQGDLKWSIQRESFDHIPAVFRDPPPYTSGKRLFVF